MYKFIFLLAILLRLAQGEASSQEEFGEILTHLQNTIKEVRNQQDATQTRLLRGVIGQYSPVEIQILETGEGFDFGYRDELLTFLRSLSQEENVRIRIMSVRDEPSLGRTSGYDEEYPSLLFSQCGKFPCSEDTDLDSKIRRFLRVEFALDLAETRFQVVINHSLKSPTMTTVLQKLLDENGLWIGFNSQLNSSPETSDENISPCPKASEGKPREKTGRGYGRNSALSPRSSLGELIPHQEPSASDKRSSRRSSDETVYV